MRETVSKGHTLPALYIPGAASAFGIFWMRQFIVPLPVLFALSSRQLISILTSGAVK